jgi:hypothetical protein
VSKIYDLRQVTRIEVIVPGKGRQLVYYGDWEAGLQDEGRTFKIFIEDKK